MEHLGLQDQVMATARYSLAGAGTKNSFRFGGNQNQVIQHNEATEEFTGETETVTAKH